MLEEAVNRLKPGDIVILHSDQVWHDQMNDQNKLKEHGIRQSVPKRKVFK